MSERLQITGVPDLQIGKSELRNTGVLKATSGNAAKRKSKTETRHSTKGSTSLTALKMIAKQGADEKSLLEEWKTDLLDKLTSEIAQIHEAHNIAMEAQREEMEGQKKQLQFEIYVLGERIRVLELKKKSQRKGRYADLSRSIKIKELWCLPLQSQGRPQPRNHSKK